MKNTSAYLHFKITKYMSNYSAELSESKFPALATSDNAFSPDALLELASVLPGPGAPEINLV